MKQPIYSTALYMRLSRDDDYYGDSVSIETQRMILTRFAQEQGFLTFHEYVDDCAPAAQRHRDCGPGQRGL